MTRPVRICYNALLICSSQITGAGGIHGTVVTHWTADQQVERSILLQGHGSQKNSSHSLRLSPAQYSLNCAKLWPKTPIIHSKYILTVDGCSQG